MRAKTGRRKERQGKVEERITGQCFFFSTPSILWILFLWIGIGRRICSQAGVTWLCSLIHVCNEGLCLNNPIRWSD